MSHPLVVVGHPDYLNVNGLNSTMDLFAGSSDAMFLTHDPNCLTIVNPSTNQVVGVFGNSGSKYLCRVLGTLDYTWDEIADNTYYLIHGDLTPKGDLPISRLTSPLGVPSDGFYTLAGTRWRDIKDVQIDILRNFN